MLVVEKFPGANTLEVTKGVEEALDKLKPGLSGMQTDTSVFRPATFIEDAIDNLTLAIVIAAVLLALVLAAFLFQWRTVLIALITIPLSLIAAALVLDAARRDVQRDLVRGARGRARGGDRRRRRGRRERRAGVCASAREAGSDRSTASDRRRGHARGAQPARRTRRSSRCWRSCRSSSWRGGPGAFFEPLALAYALAVGAAMVVALDVTPALSLLLFSRGTAGGARVAAGLRRLAPRYDGALSRFVGRPRTALIAAGACVLVGARGAAAAGHVA